MARGRPNLEALEWLVGGVAGALETLRRGDAERSAEQARDRPHGGTRRRTRSRW